MNCSKCTNYLGEMKQREAFIAVEVMGDEYIYSYWLCKNCGHYTIEVYHDRFMGEDDCRTQGPIEPDKGHETVKLMKSCSNPGDKRCDCKAHQHFRRGY
jgi:hypothetical protein